MAVRVGTDVIEIERIRRALERPGFRDRCFTPAEQDYCESRGNPAESYAARFCGKEAVGKALGCGVLFTWKEIEIVGPPKPGVTLAGKTLRWAEKVGMRTALVRTGKFRPDTLEQLDVTPDVVLSSVADLPDWLERAL